jgi:hypothetical protein
MIAICSDLDETPNRGVYLEISRYLNSTATTSMGPGLGLEVGNTIYFDMAPNQFAYWNTDDAGREMVRTLIRSGHIDCFHSFGDLANHRSHAARALEELTRHGCRLGVWIDHAIAPSNFGGDIMRGRGDLSESEVYHADLTCSYGVEYVWRGRVTSVVGQDVPRQVASLWDASHPVGSARTVVKEATKGALAWLGSQKYAMHAPNQVLLPARLRDGRPVWEFLRSNPYWAAVDQGETPDGLAEVLNDRMLSQLTEREGVMVLYTHLGKIGSRQVPFGPRTREALGGLADRYRDGRILVTTTRRLLDHCRAQREASFSAVPDDLGLSIEVKTPGDGAGLAFYVADPARTRIAINGRPPRFVNRNPPDHTGRPSISLPWPRLEFPQL